MLTNNRLKIAIIGMGPRGLYSLYSLTEEIRSQKLFPPTNIHIIEPTEIGPGHIYRTNQPQYLQFNTITAKAMAYPDNEGPSFFQWLQSQGYNFGPFDYVPRALHGKYLQSVYEKIQGNMPNNVTITPHKTTVEDIRKIGDRYILYMNGNHPHLVVDFALLSLGHSYHKSEYSKFAEVVSHAKKRNSNLNYFHSPYPAETNLSSIRAGQRVCIIGMGHAAIDAIIGLTEGKGGTFVRGADGKLNYLKSGQEPQIIAISRSGLPFYSKLRRTDSQPIPYKTQFFTTSVIDELRSNNFKTHGTKKLDFSKQLLPLLMKEIEYAYYSTLVNTDFARRLVLATPKEKVLLLDQRSISIAQKFNWNALAKPFQDCNFLSPQEFKKYLLNFLQQDLLEASKGYSSPIKAMSKILHNEIRDVLAYATEFGGLTPSSEPDYRYNFLPTFNRVAVGIHYDRAEQILALVQSGVLDIFAGPNPKINFDSKENIFTIQSQIHEGVQIFDVLIEAFQKHTDLHNNQNILITNLLKRGLIREYVNSFRGSEFHTGALDISERFEVIDRRGAISRGLYALGVLTEGKLSLTYLAGIKDTDRGALHDSENWAKNLVSLIKRLSNDRIHSQCPSMR